ncbi:MAG: hypothetical protein HQL69_07250 [Magnetococcales bacterium]|nr:hypothetical protein [Magnetococcales bacterium]
MGFIRRLHFTGKTLTLKVKFANFRQITRSRTLDHPIQGVSEIMSWTRYLFAPMEIPSQGVRLLGLTISNACEEEAQKMRQLVLPFFAELGDNISRQLRD